jgi:hypothetical protein
MHIRSLSRLRRSKISPTCFIFQPFTCRPTDRLTSHISHKRCHYCPDCLAIEIYTRLTPTNSLPRYPHLLLSQDAESARLITSPSYSNALFTIMSYSPREAGLRPSYGESSALSCVFHRVYMPPPFLKSIFFLQSNSTHSFNCSYEYNSFAGHTS